MGRAELDEKRFIAAFSKRAGEAQGEGRFLIAHFGGPMEESYRPPVEDVSLLTYYLIEGLKGHEKAVDIHGNVTPLTLGKFIYDSFSSIEPHQRPFFKVAGGSDVILAYYPNLAEGKRTAELERITSLINEGNQYFVDGDFSSALKCYDGALSVNPNSVRLWINKGTTLRNLRRLKEALLCYQRAIEIEPDNVLIRMLQEKTSFIELAKDIEKHEYAPVGIFNLERYYTKSHAIIIGISNYKYLSKLSNAVNDALGIQKVLVKKYGFSDIIPLFDQDATFDNIRAAFVDTLQDRERIGPNDRVLVFYAGHGMLRKTRVYGGDELKKGFIIPCDAKREKYSSFLEMETIIDNCQQCAAKHLLVILDCCYSGYAAMRDVIRIEPRQADDPYVERITTNRAFQVLAAGEEDEPVRDGGSRPGHSPFTGLLLDILESGEDLNRDGILTANEIGSKLSMEVMRTVTDASQRPVINNLSGSRLGDFLFAIYNISKASLSDTK